MAFDRENFAPICTDGSNNMFMYTTTDSEVDVMAGGYFNEVRAIIDVDTVIIISTPDNTDIVSVASMGADITTTTARRAVIDTPIVANNAITRAEIDTGLASVGIELPLRNSMTAYFHDLASTTHDKAFQCTYSVAQDTWYFEKLTPAV